MDYIALIQERSKTEGKIEGEKLTIYKAYKRGGDVELLSKLFGLPAKKLLKLLKK
jgi:hypothetical protein